MVPCALCFVNVKGGNLLTEMAEKSQNSRSLFLLSALVCALLCTGTYMKIHSVGIVRILKYD
jgi:hypothetical protein